MLLNVFGYANDYSFVDICKNEVYNKTSESLGISVVIPYYNDNERLRMCLQSLCHQSFPSARIEVIIADDGSQEVPTYDSFKGHFLNILHVWQPDLGFRISHVRNLGVRAATQPYVLFLDSDMIACTKLVENHLKALCVSSRVISVGFRKDIPNIQEIGDYKTQDSIPHSELDWRYSTYLKNSSHWVRFSNDQFKIVSGGNLAVDRQTLLNMPFDETFLEWGGEDNEWGYRCIKEGYYIYPNLDANSWHIKPPTANLLAEEKKIAVREFVARKCPTIYPKAVFLDTFEIPYISIWITSFNKIAFIKDAIESLSTLKYSHEIVVVDDCSTDGSQALLRQLQQSIPNLRLIEHETHLGVFEAYERALRECRGELLIQLDADDCLIVEELIDLISYMQHNPEALVFGNLQRVDECMNSATYPISKHTTNTRHQKLLEGMRIRCPRILRKRDYSRLPSRTHRETAVDYALYSKVHLVSNSKELPNVAYLYRQHSNTISVLNSVSQIQEPNKIMDENVNLLEGDFEISYTQIHERLRHYTFSSGAAFYSKHLELREPLLSLPLLLQHHKISS